MVGVGLFFSYRGQGVSFIAAKTNYIIVKSALFNHSNIYKPNAALLISDRKEIAANESLFLFNKTVRHACGYHYEIQFWASSDNQISNILFNQKCEEFLRSNSKIQSRIKAYIKHLETKPTHYIYNLQIPIAIEPINLLKSFENSDLHLFFMDRTSNRYMALSFELLQVVPIKNLADRSKLKKLEEDNAKNTIKKINTIVDSIKTIATIIEQTEVSFPMKMSGGEKIVHLGAITLRFQNGSDLKEVKKIIEKNNGIVKSETNPQYYYIQLVDTSDKLESIKERLKSYKNVTAVYEYPKK